MPAQRQGEWRTDIIVHETVKEGLLLEVDNMQPFTHNAIFLVLVRLDPLCRPAAGGKVLLATNKDPDPPFPPSIYIDLSNLFHM